MQGRSFRFQHAIVRTPSNSVSHGLRDGQGDDPNVVMFCQQHRQYVLALMAAGAQVVELPALEEFPDSVFVEDTTICFGKTAVALRPGASSRFGEVALMRPALDRNFSQVIALPQEGFVDGGDVLLSDNHAFIGLSARTNSAGLSSLVQILNGFNYSCVRVNTPEDILHFKTECGLLDSNTIFATQKLASTGCFADFSVILAPEGEEGAANIVRYNDVVFVSEGYPKSKALLENSGYKTVTIDTSEPAKTDGGLSCMSLRF